jgi:hypothetical protein
VTLLTQSPNCKTVMKKNLFSRSLCQLAILLSATLLPTSLLAQNYYDMSTGDYSNSFTGWTNYAVNWNGLPTNATGAIPSATRITTASTNIIAPGSSGGVQSSATSTNLQFLSTGATANTTSVGADLNLNFAGRNAGVISFAAAQVNNSTGSRVGTLQVYYSTDGSTWSEVAGSNLPFTVTNNVASAANLSVNLPAALNNQSAVKLRFYYYNGPTAGVTGSRPRISIDDLLVTSTPAGTAPVITSFTPSSGFPGETVTISGFNFGATPAVRFNGVAASSSVNPEGTQITATVPSGATTGKITVEVAGQDTATSATDFTVIPAGTPLLNLSTNSIAGLSTAVNTPSAPANYTVTGTNLGTTAVTITPDSPLLEVGTDGTNFASILNLTPSGGTVSNAVFVRVVATNVVTNYTSLINHVSGSASNSLTVSGAITNAAASLVLSPTNLPSFAPVAVDTPSESQVFNVAGSNLTNDVTVTAPTGFQVSNDGTTWASSTSIVQTAGTASGNISVRFAASSAFGPRFGSVLVAASGITRNLAVSGSVPVPNVPGQVYWNFDASTPTSGTGGDYAAWTFGPLTQSNNNGTTPLLSTTSASSGYTNPFNVLASGTTNAGASARTGALVPEAGATNGSAFFQVEIVVPSNTTTSITNISFGSRSTGTGPASYSIRSSADGFASDILTNALTTNSTWVMQVAPVSIALSNGTNTVRIYGFNGSGNASASTANWRIDDLTLALGTGTGPTPPSGLSYTPSSVSGVVGTAITNMVPVVTGTVTNYSVSPPLPAGLSISPTTGLISGTPTAVAASASYTVTASNAGGSTTADVTISVVSSYDGWATSYGLSGTDALPASDPDKDGLNNNNEYAFGTNPTVSNATLLTATTSAGNMTVTWVERNSGFVYNVQSTVNLATTGFANDGAVTVVAGPTDPAPPTGYTRKQFTVPASNNKFFRVRATAN